MSVFAPLISRYLPGPLARRAIPVAEKIDGLVGSDADRRASSRVALVTFSVRVMSAAIAYLMQIALARWMGTYEYGIYVVVWVWVLILGNLAGLGFPTGVLRFIPELSENKDEAGLRAVLMKSRIVPVLFATTLAGIGIGAMLQFPDLAQEDYLLPILLAAVCLPMMTLTEVQDGIARAYDWSDLALLPPYIARPLLILGFMLAFYLGGMETHAANAVIASILATWITALWQLVVLQRRLKKKVTPGPSAKGNTRLWLKAALPMLLVEGFFLLIINTDIVVAGWFLPPDQVAIYFAAAKTLALVHFVYFAIRQATAHRISSAHAQGNLPRLQAIVGDAIAWTFWPSAFLGCMLLIFGDFILSMFGEEFRAGMPYLTILLIGVMIRASIGPAETMLTMAGAQVTSARIYAVILVTNITLNVILIPAIGLMGAAIATSIAVSLETLLLTLAVKRHIGITCFITHRPRRAHATQEQGGQNNAPEAAE